MRNPIVTAFLITAALLFAQGDRGTITGIVTDPSGQIVPGVQVSITNEDTGIKSATVSSDSGSYTLPLLMVGNYRMEARAAGFKTSERPAVPVQVGQVTRIDIQLEVGQVQEQVTVAATLLVASRTTFGTAAAAGGGAGAGAGAAGTASPLSLLLMVSYGDQHPSVCSAISRAPCAVRVAVRR